MNEVRHKMLLGETVNECKDCYRHERLTGSSSRTQSNKQYINDIAIHRAVNNFLIKKTVPINNLKSLELRLGNTCNLSCNSCWGYSSSKVNEERIRILDKEKTNLSLNNLWKDEYQVPKNINRWYKTQQYQKNIETAATNLNRIYLTGGEPTLIKENRILLKNLIETNKMSLKSKPLISELKTFVATGLGFKAKSGEHDDLVSSTLLIIRMADVLADWDPQIYDKMTEKVSEESMPMPIFVSMGL